MKQTVSKHDFREAFKTMGRNDSFSYEGLGALYDYLTDMEDDTGEDMELDVIGICCDFLEYDNAREASREYGCEYTSNMYNDDDTVNEDFEAETEAYCLEWLHDRTTVIVFDSGIIIADF